MTDTDTERREPRPLAEEVGRTALEIIQECGPKYWTLGETGTDRGYQTRVTWEGPDEVTLEHTETGHAAAFVLKVTARPVDSVMGPEDDGATRAELADAHRHAMTPGPDGQSPADLILRILKLARMDHRNGCAPEWCGGSQLDPCSLASALEALDRALEEEVREANQGESGHWEPATWKDVKTGDRVRVAQQHEAEVEAVVPLTWKGSGATQVQVKLKGRPQPYTMPPSGPVEVWRPSLPDWAAQAYLVLAEKEMINHG